VRVVHILLQHARTGGINTDAVVVRRRDTAQRRAGDHQQRRTVQEEEDGARGHLKLKVEVRAKSTLLNVGRNQGGEATIVSNSSSFSDHHLKGTGVSLQIDGGIHQLLGGLGDQ
jgi:hypothetical protein